MIEIQPFDPRRWKPYHPATMLAIPLSGSGFTPAGILAMEDERAFKQRALVFAVHAQGSEGIEPGDEVSFHDGQYEEIRTATGEEFILLRVDRLLTALSEETDDASPEKT